MRAEDSILAEGRVIAVMGARLYKVELENGHQLMARVPLRLAGGFENVAPGRLVTVELSPSDLSLGIVTPENGAVKAKI